MDKRAFLVDLGEREIEKFEEGAIMGGEEEHLGVHEGIGL